MLGKGVMNLSGRNVKFFLAKPLTYMNESGNAVASISAQYQIEPTISWLSNDDMTRPGRTEVSRWLPQAGTTASNHQPFAFGNLPKYARARAWASATPGTASPRAHNTVNWCWTA
ncbi:MAG: hypothetical protein R2683_04875 [Bifidobacterium adolescentis]